jgi:UDP-N-acetylglucosamine transferase subunit ALG13
MRLFVTVGTTRFDELLMVLDDVETQRIMMERLQVDEVVVQCGSSATKPSSTSNI